MEITRIRILGAPHCCGSAEVWCGVLFEVVFDLILKDGHVLDVVNVKHVENEDLDTTLEQELLLEFLQGAGGDDELLPQRNVPAPLPDGYVRELDLGRARIERIAIKNDGGRLTGRATLRGIHEYRAEFCLAFVRDKRSGVHVLKDLTDLRIFRRGGVRVDADPQTYTSVLVYIWESIHYSPPTIPPPGGSLVMEMPGTWEEE